VPFARTESERPTAGDPRPSLEERYGNPQLYTAKIKPVAEALVTEGLLLAFNADAYIKAAESCERF
jgi:hypothetical protein